MLPHPQISRLCKWVLSHRSQSPRWRAQAWQTEPAAQVPSCWRNMYQHLWGTPSLSPSLSRLGPRMRRCPQLLALLTPALPQFFSQMGPWQEQVASHLPSTPPKHLFPLHFSGLKDTILTLSWAHTAVSGVQPRSKESTCQRSQALF